LIRAIRAYSVELVDPEYMPSNLDDFGLPEDLTCD
jgi:hypothetical protein